MKFLERVASTTLAKNSKNAHVSADFLDFAATVLLASFTMFALIGVIYRLRHKSFNGFDLKDNALLALWLTILLVLIGFGLYLANLIMNAGT